MKTLRNFTLFALIALFVLGCNPNDPLAEIVTSADNDTTPEWVDLSAWPLDSCSGIPSYLHDSLTIAYVTSDSLVHELPGANPLYDYFHFGDTNTTNSGYTVYRELSCMFWGAWFRPEVISETATTITYDLVTDWIYEQNGPVVTFSVGIVTFQKVTYVGTVQ